MYKKVQVYVGFAPFTFFMPNFHILFVFLHHKIDTTKTYRDYETFIT